MIIEFRGIEEEAARQHGGAKALRSLLNKHSVKKKLTETPDDRYLSAVSKVIFQVGFNWKVVDGKWPNFEKRFSNFKLNVCSSQPDEALEALMATGDLIKNWPKIKAIRSNAQWLTTVSEQHGSVGKRIAAIQSQDYLPDLVKLSKHGTRVGVRTAMIWMRRMGADSFVFSPDVERALFRYGVIDKASSSARSWSELQEILNQWMDETDLSLTHISQILAYSLGPNG